MNSRLLASFSWLWMLVITILTLLPSDKMEVFSWNAILGMDKLAHMCVFGLWYGLFVCIPKSQKTPGRIHWKFVLLASIYGVLLEFLQHSMYLGRHFDVLDIIANIIGLLIAALVVKQLHK